MGRGHPGWAVALLVFSVVVNGLALLPAVRALAKQAARPKRAQEVPHPLERLGVVLAGAGSGADEVGRQHLPQRLRQRGELGTAVGLVETGGRHLEAGVPLQRAPEAARGSLDGPAPEAGVQDDGLHVPVEPDSAVHLRLDVVVELVVAGGVGQGHQPGQCVGTGNGFRLEDRVGEAEGRARGHLRAQPQVRRAEPDRATVRTRPVVERAVDRTLGGRPLVVPASEQAALPPPAVATGVGGQAAVGRAGLELGAGRRPSRASASMTSPPANGQSGWSWSRDPHSPARRARSSSTTDGSSLVKIGDGLATGVPTTTGRRSQAGSRSTRR